MKFKFLRNNYGLTMIELMIAMVVLGVLTVALFIMLNPIEQMGRSKDSSRKSAVKQLVTGLQVYTSNNGSYPIADSNWMTTLSSSRELSAAAQSIGYGPGGSACSTNTQNNYCYNTDGTNAIVFVKLESKFEKDRAGCTGGESAYYLWASGDDKFGVICSTGDPANYSGYTYK